MELKEIIEGNKIICDFLKMKISSHSNPEHSVEVMFSEIWKPFYVKSNISDESIKGGIFYSHYIEFHSSWDWIFSVIEKITSLGFEIEFNIKPNWDESTFSIYDTKRDNTLVESPNFIDIENCNSLIQYVWICIVEFIQYYNQNK